MTRFLRAAIGVLFAVHGLIALAAPCPTISMAPTGLPNGDLATAYTPTVTSSGGTAPVTMDITHGVVPSGVTLTDNTDGTATFSGTATQTGSFEFTITATDANGCSGGRTYAPTFATANQTISFTSTAPVGATVGGAPYAVNATATSGLPVALTIDATASAVCSISGSSVSFIGVGTCVIDANQAGNATYGPAPQVQQSFAVGQGAQTITFTSTAPAAASVGGATYTVTATATSGLAVALTIDASASSVCSITGSTVSFTAVGTCVIDANQAGNANYTAAPQVQQSFAVGIGSQTITFTSTAPAAASVGGPTYNVTATASSGLAVTFTIDATASAVCSIAGSTVSFTGAGLCVIDANQAGNANYSAAPQAQQSFGVGKSSQTITYTSTAPVGATVGGATYTVTATATSGLIVALTIDASASTVCSIAGSTVSFIGVGTCVIDANQAGDANYNQAPQVQQSFAVGKGNQTITYTSTAPVGATVGGATYNVTATASSGLVVALTIDASASTVCSIAGSTVSFIGVGTCVIDANQAGNANYNPAPQAQQSFAVGKGNQTVTFTSTAPVGATVGGATYTVTATASSGLAVALTIDASASTVCSIAGSTVSFIGVGTCVIDANQAGDANYNPAPQVQQSFAVGKGNQTITFTSTAPVGATVGGATYTVTATASSGLVVALTIDASASAVCSITGSTVSFTGAGLCVIDANQAGNANYNAAPQAQQSFAVGKASQTITYTSTAPVGATVGGATYNVTATASSGLIVALTIDASASTVCSIAGSTVSFIGVGTCVIDANQAGDANYNPAPQVQQSFAVAKGAQTITYTSTAPVGATVGGATYTVTATGGPSGNPVTFTIDAAASAVCSITGSTVSFIGVGTCVIDANQAGNANYNPAPQAQQSFLVGKGSQTITFTSTAPSGATFNGPTYTVTATASSGLTVALTIDASATSVCSIAGSTVSFIGVGTCVIDANQAGDANWNAAPQAQQSFAVAKANQTISFTSTAPSGALVNGPTYNVTATSTSGLTVALTIDASASAVCSIAGSTVSFNGAGTCIIDANQAGNTNYNAAPQVQQSFVVSKNNQTISFTSTAPATAKNAGPTYTVSATATSGLAVTFTSATTGVCTVAGSTVTFVGAGTCTINADQAGNFAYNAAPQVQQSFLVAKGDQTVSFTSVPPTFGATVAPNHTYTVTGTATPSGLAVVFTIDAASTAVCSIAGATVTFNAAGTCTIDANQPGDTNWNPATQVQQSITVLVPATAVADSHAVTGNVGIASTSSVLTNDTGTAIVIKSYGVNGNEQTTIGNATPTAQGGSVTLVAGGTYTYTPASNFTGSDSFKYIIDNGLVRPSTGTVTLTVTDRIVVVSLAGGGTCSPVTPSPCALAVADAAPIASGKDLVFVESGTYPAAVFTLFAAQNLVGQQVSLSQAITDVGITLATDSVGLATIAASTRPVFNNAGTVITLGGGNLVEYFNINPTGGSAITSSAVTTGANVHDVTITGTGAANGVNLTGNSTGSTFNFSNLVITTATGNAFSAVGPGPGAATGGTVIVTTGSTPNTLTSTTGTALNLVNTTIGAGNLNFRSITAGTAASGPVSGIVLNNTGATGGLIVTGTGAAASGGTIQKTTGSGILLTTVGGSASLTDMNVSNTTGDGITATTVKNFSCTLCNLTNPGGAANKSGMKLAELSGAVSLTNVTVTGSATDGVNLTNTSATLTSLTVSGGSYGSTNNAFATAGSGLIVIAKTTGVITAATVSGVTFNANFSSAIQSFAQDTATIGDITVSGCTFTNNGAAAADFDAGTGTGNIKFHFLNNLTITGNVGPVVNVFSSATATGGLIQGRIDGNVIGTNAVTDSGSTGGAGIRVFLQGAPGNITIVNNTIRSTACSRGIDVQTLGPAPAQGSARQSDIVITGNNVNNFSSDCAFPLNDIYLTSDAQTATGSILRADVHTNTIKTAGASPGNTDFPFDNLEWLYFDHTAGTAQLVGSGANANAVIAGSQTSGSAKANAAVSLIPGPITTVP